MKNPQLTTYSTVKAFPLELEAMPTFATSSQYYIRGSRWHKGKTNLTSSVQNVLNLLSVFLISWQNWPDFRGNSVQFSSVQSFSCIRLFVTPWTAAHQASLSITNSWSLLKLMSIESVMPSNHLIFCHPLLLPPSIFPSIRVFPNESALCIRWLKYWSFSFNISPSNEHSDWFPLGWTGLISLQSKGLSRVFNTMVQKHQFFGTQLSL